MNLQSKSDEYKNLEDNSAHNPCYKSKDNDSEASEKLAQSKAKDHSNVIL